jgi:hypothetical protein
MGRAQLDVEMSSSEQEYQLFDMAMCLKRWVDVFGLRHRQMNVG